MSDKRPDRCQGFCRFALPCREFRGLKLVNGRWLCWRHR